MEASTPAQPGSDQLQAALSGLASDVASLQTRVNSDLENLKQQVASAQQSGGQVNYTEIVAQIEEIQTTVTSIDAQAVAPTGDTPAPGGDPAAAPTGDVPTGDQGVPAGQPAADAVQGDPSAGQPADAGTATPAADAPPAGGGENTAPGA